MFGKSWTKEKRGTTERADSLMQLVEHLEQCPDWLLSLVLSKVLMKVCLYISFVHAELNTPHTRWMGFGLQTHSCKGKNSSGSATQDVKGKKQNTPGMQ